MANGVTFRALFLGVLAACLGVLAPGAAHAGNDDEVLIGNEAALTGGAVTANGSGGASAWYNPAAAAATTRTTVDVSTSAFTLRRYHAERFVEAASGERNDGEVTEFLSVPSAVTTTKRLSESLTGTLGVYVSRAQNYVLQETLPTKQPGLRSEWFFNARSSQSTYHLGGTLGWRVAEQLRLGLTLYGVYQSTSVTGQFFGSVGVDDGSRSAAGSVTLLSAWSLGLELGLGAQWEPTDRLRLGLSVRSPGLEIFTHRESTDVELVAVAPADGEPEVGLQTRNQGSDEFGIERLRPTRVRMGAAYEFDRGLLSAGFDVQPPAENQEFGVDRQTTWNARLGGTWQYSETVTLGLGGFTDRSPAPDPQDFVGVQADFYGLAGGVRMSDRYALAEGEESEQIEFSTTLAVRYAAGVGEVGNLRIDFSDEAVATSRDVDLLVHEFSVNLGSAVRF